VAESEPGAEPPPRHLGAGAALSIVADLGPLVSVGVLSIVLARTIGPAGNGTYALLATLVTLVVLVCSLGLAAGITYQVSRRAWPLSRALPETYGVALLLGLIGAGLGAGFYALTDEGAMRSVDATLVTIALAAIPAFVAVQFATAMLLGRDRYEAYAGLQLTTSAVVLVAAAGLAIPFGLTGAVAGLAASAVIGAVAGAILVRRQTRRGFDTRQTRVDHRAGRPLRVALRFGALAWAASLLQQVNYRFDVLILGAYASAADVGVYSVALTLTSIAWILPHGLQTVVFPRTASVDAAVEAGEMSVEESDAGAARASRHSVILVIPAGLIVGVLLALVPLVYGRSFDRSVALGLVLLPGVLALGTGKVLSSVVAGRGKPRYNLYNSLLVAAITLGLYFTLIPAFGVWGAAIASSLSYLATAVIAVGFFHRVVGVPLAHALIPTRADLRNYLEGLNAFRASFRSRLVRRRAA